MNETDRVEFARQETTRQNEAILRNAERYCPQCCSPSPFGGDCSTCIINARSAETRSPHDVNQGFCPSCSTPSPGGFMCPPCVILLDESAQSSEDARLAETDVSEAQEDTTEPMAYIEQTYAPLDPRDPELPQDHHILPEAGGPLFEAAGIDMPAMRCQTDQEPGSEPAPRIREPSPFYCPNCSTVSPTSGLCPSCNFVLREQDAGNIGELSDMAERFANPSFAVDTTTLTGARARTSLDFPRDAVLFWQRLLETHEELFSADNIALILLEQAPEVDETWLRFHPGQDLYLHDRLVHHHWDQGPMALGIPETFHLLFTKLLHPLRYPDE